MFRLPAFCCSPLYNLTLPHPTPTPSSLLPPQSHSFRVTWDAISQTWSSKYSHQIKYNSQFFSSVLFSCSVVSNSMDLIGCSMPGLPVHHQLLELTQTHVHWVSDAIQPSHPLSPAFNLSQHQGIFKWVSSSHQVARVFEFQLQHQSFQRIFRTDFL